MFLHHHRRLVVALNLFLFFPILVNTLIAGENSVAQMIQGNSDFLPTQSRLNTLYFPSREVLNQKFERPDSDFSSAPLWVWNDYLTENQIRSSLRDFSNQGILQAIVHPRPGLATPYLSDEWFKAWQIAIDEAQNLNMKLWIYDENSYPSGFAGGLVPDAFPETIGEGIDVRPLLFSKQEYSEIQLAPNTLFVVTQSPDGRSYNLTSRIIENQEGKALPLDSIPADSRLYVITRQESQKSQWFGGKTYVNLLSKGVLEKFLSFTHEAYRQHFSSYFGSLIKGSFTDEPNVASAGMFSWSDDFPEEFLARRGYDIVPLLPSLVEPINNWAEVRYDFYKTVLELLIDRWHKPYSIYCEYNNLEYTGHDWEHEWPIARGVPDNMATAFWRQRPAIDLLMNQFDSNNIHAQFGNVRAVRELNSVAHQSGKSRTLSENYGAGGYDIRFADLKRLGDWSFALGVNTLDEHLSYISIKGARKHDHPQTFSYHSYWFDQYKYLEEYWTRLSYILSCGELTNERFLVLEPTSTVWLYQHPSDKPNDYANTIALFFPQLLNFLENNQIDYDLGSEEIIRRVGSVQSGRLQIGKASYRTVLLPPLIDNLDQVTIFQLAQFASEGGKILSLGAMPTLVNGRSLSQMEASLVPELHDSYNRVKERLQHISFEDLKYLAQNEQPVSIIPIENSTNIFHQIRQTDNTLIFFLCNIDQDNQAIGRFVFNDEWRNASIEKFDPMTGNITPYSSQLFKLNPCESITLVASIDELPTLLENSSAPVRITSEELRQNNCMTSVQPIDENVLVIDYLKLKINGEEVTNDYFYRANDLLWKRFGFPKSPWDNGVQFKDTLVSKKFDKQLALEIEYAFKMDSLEIPDLQLVIENPTEFRVSCNGTDLNQQPGAWKFDRSFGVYEIAHVVHEGLNVIKLATSNPSIYCELSSIWITGTFSLKPADQSFIITAPKAIVVNEETEGVLQASSDLEGVSWLSSGINFTPSNDLSPRLSFKFDKTVQIDAVRIWNYCERNLSKRGVKDFSFYVLDQDGQPIPLSSTLGREYTLKEGDCNSELIELDTPIELQSGDSLILEIHSNWNGIRFPLSIEKYSEINDGDNAFVGLAEIEFLSKHDGHYILEPIAPHGVTASSELVFRTHNRRAQFIVDGSGQFRRKIGWASQGSPFYQGRVGYTFDFPIAKFPLTRDIRFELSEWNGVVTSFNNNQAIGWNMDSIDLTDEIQNSMRKGEENVLIQAQIYGSPKNLFGPHHAGSIRGSAWPGHFHQAPSTPPSGSSYDFIEYGLFN